MTSTCTPERAKEILQAGDGAQAIDVREFPEYAAGHAAGTKLLPLSELPGRIAEVAKERPVVVFCKAGVRAARAATLLSDAGCRNVNVVEGGTDAWIARGLPVERLERAPWSLERQVRFAAGLLVVIGLMLPGRSWLAGIIGVGLMFAAVTNTCAMGMLIAKAPWNRRT